VTDKILIVKLGALGDVINTLPLAVSLKRSLDCSIDWLTAPLSLPLVQDHPCVDRAIRFDRKQGLRGILGTLDRIREARYDITLDLQRILKSGLFAMAARTRRRLGFDRGRCKELSWIFPLERIPAGPPKAHMVDQYLEFARVLGAEPCPVAWRIPLPGDRGPAPLSPFAVLNIGATKPANLWKEEHFAALAQGVEEILELVPVLTGGPEDVPRAARIMAATRGRALDLTGRTSLHELVAVIGNARCVVSCDTGPMHLASALGVPLVALFGPSDPARTGPYRGRVIRKPLACSPCNRKHCQDPRCMEAIQPGEVLSAMALEMT
jgi:heptosyltransferase-1